MEIELPDGTILDAPDDADPSAVAKAYLKNQRVAALKQSNPAEYDPESAEYQARYGATSGMSDWDKFIAGAGKSVVDMGRGLQQLTGFRTREEQDESNRLDAPLMNSGAGVAGNVAGTVATMFVPGGVVGKAGQAASAVPRLATAGNALARTGRALVNPQTVRSAAAGGALMGGLQPVGTDESRLLNVGLGAATAGATQGIVQGIGRVAQPLKNALSPVDEKAVRTLESAGVALDAAQKSGSQRAMQVKRFLADNPLTTGGQVRQAEKTASTFTKAALKEIGANADAADEQVLGQAYTRIGRAFDDVASRNPIKADNQLLTDLSDIAQKSAAELEAPQAAVIAAQVDEVINKASGTGAIDGRAYLNIKTTLDRIGNGQNQQIGFWARELRAKLDDALQRSASQVDVGKLKTARMQYRNFLAIEKALNPDGNVSPAKLFNAFNVKAYGGKRGMSTGKGANDLMRLAKAGKRIIPERMPNSGTTPRGMLQAVIPAAAGGAYGFSQEGNLGDAAKFAALGIGAPYAAQRLLNSPAAAQYLTQGLQGPMRSALLAGPGTTAGMLARQAPLAGLLALQPQQ